MKIKIQTSKNESSSFQLKRPFQEVWLLGSIPELGEWNPARAIECGHVASEWNVWQATVRLPTDSSFHWAWCDMTLDGHLKNFENGDKRFRQISCFSGTLHTIFGEPDVEVFRQNMGSAMLTTERKTRRRDVVAVIGSCPTLGCWDPHQAVVATEFPRRSGKWSANVFFDSARLQEWNWVVIDKNTKEIRLAEKYGTRFLYDTHGWIKIHVEWNKEPAVVDWAPRDHVGDDYLGSVELLRKMKARMLEIRRWEDAAEAKRLGRPAGRILPSPTFMGLPNLPPSSSTSFLTSASMYLRATSPTVSIVDNSPSSIMQQVGQDASRIPFSGAAGPSPNSGRSSSKEAQQRAPQSPQSVLQIKPLPGGSRTSPHRSVSPGTGDQKSPTTSGVSVTSARLQTREAGSASRSLQGGDRGGNQPSTASPSGGMSLATKGSASQTIDTTTDMESDSEALSGSERKKKRQGTPVDMSQLRFHCTPPSQPAERGRPDSATDEKRRNVVSDPGKPGFTSDPHAVLPGDEEGQGRRYHSLSTSPPLFHRYENSRPRGADGKIAPTPGIESYLGHSLLGRDAGILVSNWRTLLVEGGATISGTEGKVHTPRRSGADKDHLKLLKEMTDMREQARALDRMELIRQREDRNKAKFQHGLDFAAAALCRRSPSPPRHRPSSRVLEKGVESEDAQDDNSSAWTNVKNNTSSNYVITRRSVARAVKKKGSPLVMYPKAKNVTTISDEATTRYASRQERTPAEIADSATENVSMKTAENVSMKSAVNVEKTAENVGKTAENVGKSSEAVANTSGNVSDLAASKGAGNVRKTRENVSNSVERVHSGAESLGKTLGALIGFAESVGKDGGNIGKEGSADARRSPELTTTTAEAAGAPGTGVEAVVAVGAETKEAPLPAENCSSTSQAASEISNDGLRTGFGCCGGSGGGNTRRKGSWRSKLRRANSCDGCGTFAGGDGEDKGGAKHCPRPVIRQVRK